MANIHSTFSTRRLKARPDEISLGPRMLTAPDLAPHEKLHPVTECSAAEKHPPHQILPGLVGRAPAIGHKSSIRFMGRCTIVGMKLIQRPARLQPVSSQGGGVSSPAVAR